MYCSISFSRAWRSPSSWYCRRRILSSMRGISPRPPPEPPCSSARRPRRFHRAARPRSCRPRSRGRGGGRTRRRPPRARRAALPRTGRPSRRPQRPSTSIATTDVAVVVAAAQQAVECGLQVVEILVGQVEPRAEPAEHELRDAAEILLRGYDERDLVTHARPHPRHAAPRRAPARAAPPRPCPPGPHGASRVVP